MDAVKNSVNTNVNKRLCFCSFFHEAGLWSGLCCSTSQKLRSQRKKNIFFATWFLQLHLHHNSASYLKCKTKVYWSRNRQWYKSVHLLLAANRGFRTTQSSSLCPHFRVSLKQKEKQSNNPNNPFRILCVTCVLYSYSLTYSTWQGPPAVCSSVDRD